QQLGEFDSARKAFETSIDLLTVLASEAEPDEVKYRQELAESHIWLGLLLKPMSSEDAFDLINQAVTIQQDVAQISSGDQSSEYGLARALYNRGMLLGEQDDDDAAEKDFLSAIRLLSSLLDESEMQAADDSQSRMRVDLGRTLNNYGNLLKKRGQTEAAKERITDAIDLYHQRTLNREQREDLAVFRNNLSNTLATLGMLDEAATENEQAIEILEQLVQDFPQYTNLKDELSNTLNSRGALAGRQGKLDKAAELFARSDSILTGLTEKYPSHNDYINRLGNAKYNRALVDYMQQSYSEAMEWLDEAIDLHATCLTSNVKNSEFAANLKKDHSLAAQSCLKLEDWNGLLNVVDQSAGAFPDDPSTYMQTAKWLARGYQSFVSNTASMSESDTLSADDLASAAVGQLRRAVECGQSPNAILQDDRFAESFAPLQDHDGFRQLLSELRLKPSNETPPKETSDSDSHSKPNRVLGSDDIDVPRITGE
ncbi:MAG: tetratricopeptide repeat protein, partial [Planctomycetota bacterium]